MQHYIEPDVGIDIVEGSPKIQDFAEKAQAACETAKFLGLDTTPTQADTEMAEQAVYDAVEDPVAGNKKALAASKKMTAPVYVQTKHILDAYALKVVENAAQIRLMVTNKLIIESENEDPKIRLRSLELLGKITDVGLFTEKSEVTINNRSSQELVMTLKEKIQKLMYPQDIQDAEVVEVGEMKVNLDEELDGTFDDDAETNAE